MNEISRDLKKVLLSFIVQQKKKQQVYNRLQAIQKKLPKKRMGNDGGDIPKRKQLVKSKAKVERPSMESIAMGRSRFCNLTNQKLKQPLAFDRLGCIFNYENIIKALVEKNLPDKYGYIKKISDIKKALIERTLSESQNYIACPITKLEYNGFNKFVGLWTCGHILSRKAFKEIGTQVKNCMVCDLPYEDKDVIDLNLQGQQLQVLRKVLIEKKKKIPKQSNGKLINHEQLNGLGNPSKKVKTDVHISAIDRLSGQFRDVLREREQFKGVFSKHNRDQEWKQNTFTVDKRN